MGEGGSLGGARRSRRIDDHGRLVVDALDGLVDRIGPAEQVIERSRFDEQARGARLVAPAARRLLEAVPADHQPCARVGEVEGDLIRRQQRVHGHDDCTQPQHGVIDDREVRNVRELHPHPVPGTYALGVEQACSACYGLVQCSIGQCQVVELDRGVLGRHRCRHRRPEGNICHLNPFRSHRLRESNGRLLYIWSALRSAVAGSRLTIDAPS